MTPSEVEFVARNAAERVVRDVFREEIHDIFSMLGIDINDQKSVNRLRADLIAARELREFKETAKKRFWFIVIGAGTLAAISAFWEGIKIKMGW